MRSVLGWLGGKGGVFSLKPFNSCLKPSLKMDWIKLLKIMLINITSFVYT